MDIFSGGTGCGGLDAAFLAGAVFAFLVAAVVPIGCFASRIAREKGYSGGILIWAWLPIVNVFGLMMFVGMPNLAARAKIDALATKLTPPTAAKCAVGGDLGK